MKRLILILWLAVVYASLSELAPAQMLQSIVGAAEDTVAPAAITLGVHGTADNGAVSANTISLNLATPTAGSTLYCVIRLPHPFGGWSGFDFSDNVNGRYQTAISPTRSGGNEFQLGAFYHQNVAASATTVTATWATAGTNARLSCAEWKNVHTAFVFDEAFPAAQRVGGGSNPTSGATRAPSVDNSVVLGALGDTAAATVGAGFTYYDTLAQFFPQYWIQTTRTATNNPYTASSGNYVNFMTALAPYSTGFCDSSAVLTFEGGTAGVQPTAADLQAGTHGIINQPNVENLTYKPGWVVSDAGNSIRYLASSYTLATPLNCPYYVGTANEIPALDVQKTFGPDGNLSLNFANRLSQTTAGACINTDAPNSNTGVNEDVFALYSSDIGATDYANVIVVNTSGTLQIHLEPQCGSASGTLNISPNTDYWVRLHYIQGGQHAVTVYDGCGASPTLVGAINATCTKSGGGPAMKLALGGPSPGTDTTHQITFRRGVKLDISGQALQQLP